MTDYVPIERARMMAGLRLVATPGIPNPWTESAKGILHVKGLPYARVAQLAGEANAELMAWTGVNSAPVLVHDDAAPLAGWVDILLLAERLAPAPALIPSDEQQRAAMFGFAHELCSRDGFGWNRRLLFFAEAEAAMATLGPSVERAGFDRMNRKYGHGGDAAHARERLVAILGLLAGQLTAQWKMDSSYYVGERLTALDIYAACFMAMLRPLPRHLCPMSDELRASYNATDPILVEAADPILFAHRDFIYETHLELPIRL